jgi:hypothetical protein
MVSGHHHAPATLLLRTDPPQYTLIGGWMGPGANLGALGMVDWVAVTGFHPVAPRPLRYRPFVHRL